ncbi:16S rRNA processing protein RimM [Paraperlucidibaca baekdonensis]|uniref:Ribosome maturation factor RimM n=1 Tax=Paraperlucidibaca baekdonensis TaxID=748120 RepID=A0A3E0H4A1_9GAMM|nr:ribosome maturation factor RimM [Paraperlucidibaca baekdonensis]REH37654.1 16S rRNA processing protein RimM [Paraperlucidibaca baekdonensis]
MVPDRESLIQVGHVHTAYGIKGWVWVMSRTDPIANIFSYGPWYLDRGGVLTEVDVLSSRPQAKGLVAHLAHCPDRNAADALFGAGIWVPKAALPTLEDDEYYWSELIDMTVVTEQDVLLGRIHAMMETGANDVIVVRACEGSLDDQERLLPWLPGRVVRFVDRNQRRVRVDWDPTF